MSNKITLEAKQKAHAYWLKNQHVSKGEVAEMHGMSSRTFRRFLEQFKEVEIEKSAEPVQTDIEDVIEEEEETSPTEIGVMASSDAITLFTDDEKRTVSSDDKDQYEEVMSQLVSGNINEAWKLSASAGKKVIEMFTEGLITVKDGVVKYRDSICLRNSLSERIQKMVQTNDIDEAKRLSKLLENLLDNPYKDVVSELFDFLRANDVKLTDDGCFIAWKKVKKDFKDIYTGKFDNSPGKEVSVPFSEVNTDSNQTCSAGLHACSKTYLSFYGNAPGNKVVSVKINPRDVGAVPKDYNNAKMRVCRYKVLEDVTSTIMNY